LRDERAAPLFAFIIRQGQYRGPLERVYVTCIDLLGALRTSSDVALQALEEAARRGEWYAPFRTRRLRATAVRALGAIGSVEARGVLQQLAASSPRFTQTAARAALADAGSPASDDPPPDDAASPEPAPPPERSDS
ncbi:MAG TPA: hypothetical protein VMW48_16215, partial [Vicinamibacterales bacterium]|nr:hypothetical protein [Vicinamibacterales bacterium]